MGQIIGGGKSRSRGRTGPLVPQFITDQILPEFSPLQSEFLGQTAEALRTGGIGAQIPIVQQSVSEANSALSRGLQGTEQSLSRSGLAGTPFGERTLAGARIGGLQNVARIPTENAQQQISAAPQLVQGLLAAMLGALAANSNTASKSGPFST